MVEPKEAEALGAMVAGLCLITGLLRATPDKLRVVTGEFRVPCRTAGSRTAAGVPAATPDTLREIVGEAGFAVALLRLAGRTPWRTAGSRKAAGAVAPTVVEAPTVGLL